MKTSTERILTTHTGSIARPDDLIELMRARENGQPYDQEAFEARVTAAVADCVRRQVEAGLDVINDGEQRKSGFATYLTERIGGFETLPDDDSRTPMESWPEVGEFPEYYKRYFRIAMFGAMLSPQRRLVCRSPVTYTGQDALAIDIANLKAALADRQYTEVFMSAAMPTGLAEQQNEYYRSREDFLTALADAVHEEYRTIIDAGFLIQLDDPAAARLWGHAGAEPAERDRRVAEMVELINYTLRDIPAEKVRYHTCYGINQGPHIYDLRLRDFIEPMLKVNAQAVSFEVMNTRHLHDYHAFEDVKLPEGKIIIPGMLSNGANWVEHPELIAECTRRYADLVGRENVMIGNDCGFASQAGRSTPRWPGPSSPLSPRAPASRPAGCGEAEMVRVISAAAVVMSFGVLLGTGQQLPP
jgi:5-methyltetrahydropteroyltriglutamate--homocysteine methyltransferase